MERALAREFWHELEALHAVTYFTGESRDARKNLGLRGFWMGYFAARAAPMGAASPGLVTATFYNFDPVRVRRSIPDAWGIAHPSVIVEARADAAAEALLRLAPDGESAALELLPQLQRVVEHADGVGRPLFSANRHVPVGEGLAGVWRAATTLREHRGDGHVAVLTEAHLDGCEAHVLIAAARGGPPEVLRENRGWSKDDWHDASNRLGRRGLVDDDGTITPTGLELHRDIERRTDELAARAYSVLSDEEVQTALGRLRGIARRVLASGEIPFPNPIGLPAPRSDR